LSKGTKDRRLNVSLRKTDNCFYVSLPLREKNEKSISTPRLSQIEDPKVRKEILDCLSRSAAGHGGADLIFDISTDGKIIGVEFLL